MSTKIDLAAVRLARANLRRLAAEHPELTTADPQASTAEAWVGILREDEETTMARPRGEPTTLVNVRLPVALVERLDATAAKLSDLPVSRTAMVRRAIERGLDAIDAEQQKAGGRR